MAGLSPNSQNIDLIKRAVVATPVLVVHPEYNYWKCDWESIRDAVHGEREVKRKQDKYLPRMKGASNEDYESYLKRAVFYNMARQTLNGMTGQVFRREPMVRNLPKDLEDNVRRLGKDGSSHDILVKTLVREQISVGRCGALVDAPAGDRTGLPPEAFVVLYTAENILDWQVAETKEGNTYPVRVLLREFEREDTTNYVNNAFYSYRTIYRELLINAEGNYQVNIYYDDPMSTVVRSVVPTIRGVPLTYIPFVFFGAESNVPDIEAPPLLDICTLNFSHYRTYADLEHGRLFTALPVYYAPGADDGDDEGPSEYHIGPNMVWEVPHDSKPGILEFTGTGLKALESALASKEQQIAAIGGRLMPGSSRSISESDNQSALREANEHALLLNVIKACEQGMTRILRMWASFLDHPLPTTRTLRYEIDTFFLTSPIGARELRAIQMMYEAGLVPVEVLYEYLRKAEVVPSTMALDEFVKMLKDPNSFINNPNVAAKQRGFADRKQELDQVWLAREADAADRGLDIQETVAEKPTPAPGGGKPA